MARVGLYAEEHEWPGVRDITVVHIEEYLSYLQDRVRWFGEWAYAPHSITTSVRRKRVLDGTSWLPSHTLDSFVALRSVKLFPPQNQPNLGSGVVIPELQRRRHELLGGCVAADNSGAAKRRARPPAAEGGYPHSLQSHYRDCSPCASALGDCCQA